MRTSQSGENVTTIEELSKTKVLIKRRIGPMMIWVMGVNILCACTSFMAFMALLVIPVMIPGMYSSLGVREMIGVMACYVALIYVLFRSLKEIKSLRDFKLVLNEVMDAETPEDLEGTIVEKFMEENS